MILPTPLKHIATAEDHAKVITENKSVMICCGRMGPMCVPVYAAMDSLQEEYPNIEFRDMLFDSPEAHVIKNHPAANGFMGLPFTFYYKDGEVVKATSSIQSMAQIRDILDEQFK